MANLPVITDCIWHSNSRSRAVRMPSHSVGDRKFVRAILPRFKTFSAGGFRFAVAVTRWRRRTARPPRAEAAPLWILPPTGDEGIGMPFQVAPRPHVTCRRRMRIAKVHRRLAIGWFGRGLLPGTDRADAGQSSNDADNPPAGACFPPTIRGNARLRNLKRAPLSESRPSR